MLHLILLIVIVSVLILLSLQYNYWRLPVSWALPRVIMYHSVDADSLPSGLNTKPEKLEQHLQYLIKKNFKFVFVSELDLIRDYYKVVALTFDDGYENNYTQLFPLLKKYGIKATIYIAPNVKGLKKLNAKQIAQMQKSNLVEFGAHTVNHINLCNVDEKTAEAEISKSKIMVEKLTGTECKTFSYPFGKYNASHVNLVKKHGFTTAVTTKKNLKVFSSCKLLEIPRISSNGNMNMQQYKIALSRGRYRV